MKKLSYDTLSPSRGVLNQTDSHSAGQTIALIWNPEFQHSERKSPPLVPVVRKMCAIMGKATDFTRPNKVSILA
jgi:hypothetical protein